MTTYPVSMSNIVLNLEKKIINPNIETCVNIKYFEAPSLLQLSLVHYNDQLLCPNIYIMIALIRARHIIMIAKTPSILIQYMTYKQVAYIQSQSKGPKNAWLIIQHHSIYVYLIFHQKNHGLIRRLCGQQIPDQIYLNFLDGICLKL